MPNENSSDLECNEFLRIISGLYNKVFPEQKIKVKRKSFDSLWTTKGLVKCKIIKEEKKLYEHFLKNMYPGKELNYKQYKT